MRGDANFTGQFNKLEGAENKRPHGGFHSAKSEDWQKGHTFRARKCVIK